MYVDWHFTLNPISFINRHLLTLFFFVQLIFPTFNVQLWSVFSTFPRLFCIIILSMVSMWRYLLMVNCIQFSTFAWNTHFAVFGDWQGSRQICIPTARSFVGTHMWEIRACLCVYVLIYRMEDMNLSPGRWRFHRGCHLCNVILYHQKTVRFGELYYRVAVPVVIRSHKVCSILVSSPCMWSSWWILWPGSHFSTLNLFWLFFQKVNSEKLKSENFLVFCINTQLNNIIWRMSEWIRKNWCFYKLRMWYC